MERRRSLDEAIINAELKKRSIVYKPIIMNVYQSKTDIKEDELSDGFS
jgi:hypothetical protein